MSDGFLKKSGQKVTDVAKAVAKQAVYEQKEFVSTAKKQLGVEPSGPSPDSHSLVDEIVTGSGVTTSVPTEVHANIHTQERKRLQELEEELHKASEAQQAKLASWQKAQQEVLSPPKEETLEPLIEPTTHPKVGVLGGVAQKARGGLEVMKGKK